MRQNPYGHPPRIPPIGRGIVWYGERWYEMDAARAAGIHPNTLTARKRRMAIAEALSTPTLHSVARRLIAIPTTAPTTGRKRVPHRRRERVPSVIIRSLMERVESLTRLLSPGPIRSQSQGSRAFDKVCGTCGDPYVALSPTQKECNPCRYGRKAA